MSFGDFKRNKNPNIVGPTLGGNYCWDTIMEKNGYKLQQMKVGKHCRIIDKDNYRIANGTRKSMFEEFEKISNGLRKPSRINIPTPTLGGKIFWENIQQRNGYTLQQYKGNNYCRILNSSNVRIARGHKSEMEQVFNNIVTGQLSEDFLTSLSIDISYNASSVEYLWDTVCIKGIYEIQRHKILQTCRILDMRNVCIATGTERAMLAKLDMLQKDERYIKLPKYGDVIGVCRGHVYDHYGIYENDNSVIEFAAEDGDFGRPVIHQTTFSDFINSSRKCFVLVFPDVYGLPGKMFFSPDVAVSIRSSGGLIDNFFAFINSINADAEQTLADCLEALDASSYYHIYSPQETVARAKSCIGKTNFGNGTGEYALRRNNCEHFALWCKTGLRQSMQADGPFMRGYREFSFIKNQY